MTTETATPESAALREVLVNLARRCRFAKSCARRVSKDASAPESIRTHYAGEALEAWNSFQAAKTIVAEHGAWRRETNARRDPGPIESARQARSPGL